MLLRVRAVLAASAALVLLLPSAAPAADGNRYALIVQGASGEEQYAKLHRTWTTDLATALRERFRYPAGNVVVVAEQPLAGETRSTADNVRAAVAALAQKMTAADQLVVFFIGHGTAEGAEGKFNLIGPDMSVADWKAVLQPVPGRLVVVDTTSASFPFLAGLAGEGRVVITATNTARQGYHTRFPDAFLKALASPETDLDKNGRLSFLELFTQTSRLVKLHFEQSQERLMATEVAVFDDDGDGKGRIAGADGTDGRVAGLTYIDAPAAITTTDPELQKLLTRQQALQEQIDDLRRRQGAMPPAEFTERLEALIVELAEVSREVRRRQGN